MEVSAAEPDKLEHGMEVASPCVGICKYASPADLVCVGCGRTEPEITDWIGLSNREKQQVIERIYQSGIM
jgi:predicted Fe-S protein YdhL (DUF1289 family)